MSLRTSSLVFMLAVGAAAAPPAVWHHHKHCDAHEMCSICATAQSAACDLGIAFELATGAACGPAPTLKPAIRPFRLSLTHSPRGPPL
jgi:hypothetical protein